MTDAERLTVGIVGLGRVGLTVARQMLGEGYQVVGYRRSTDAGLADLGGIRAGSPQEVAERADVVFLALPSTEAAEEVCLGQSGLVAAAGRDIVIVDLGTSALETKRRLSTALSANGMTLLDCPVSGMPAGTGKIAMLLGSGERSAFELCAPLLGLFAADVEYLGKFGNGTTMKLVMNLLVAQHNVAAAEGLALGVCAGLDPHVILDVVSRSPGASWMFEHRAPLMVAEAYLPARGAIDMMRKDLAAITAVADDVGCSLPLLEATVARYDDASNSGFGDHDVGAIYALLLEEIARDSV